MRALVLAAVVTLAAGCGSSSEAPLAAQGATSSIETSTAGLTTTTTTAAVVRSSTASSRSSTTRPEATGTTTATSAASLPGSGTGVRGRVTAGPTCPVERPDEPCPPQPVHAGVRAAAGDGHTASSTTTDADGRYALALAPGDYTLQVVTDGRYPMCPDTPVRVMSGPPQTVDIGCDTGIR